MPAARQRNATLLWRRWYPRNASSLGVSSVAMLVQIIGEQRARGQLGSVEAAAAAKETRRRGVHHGRAGGVEAIDGVVHGGGGSRCYQSWVWTVDGGRLDG